MTGENETGRLGLPFIQAGQAQKELWHNEALLRLDLLVQASVEAVGRDDPPVAPVAEPAWVVGDAPTGAWTGHARAVAGWSAGGWRFVAPVVGMAVWSIADRVTVRFVDGAWTTGTGAAIAGPTGGGMIDAEARAALTAVLAVLRANHLIAR